MTQPIVEDVNIRDALIEKMSISMSDGVKIGDAAKIAADWILSENLAEDFIRDLGPRVIAAYWRDRNKNERKGAFDPQRGNPRIDRSALNDDDSGSPYALMWNVPGVGFFSFGELTVNHCTAIAEHFDTSAKRLALKREFFKVVAGRLSFNKTVEESISEDDLWDIMKQHGVRPGEDDEPD